MAGAPGFGGAPAPSPPASPA